MVKVIFEDNMIVVVEKRAGLLTQSDHTGEIDLLTEVKQYIKTKYKKQGNVFIGLVHRLDRNVGGVIVFAKNSKSASRISEQIRNGDFKKEYLCVVQGIVKKESDYLEDYLIKDTKNNFVKVSAKEKVGAKIAKLSYEVLSIDKVRSYSLLKIKLETGRSHQIRVQLSNIGHPIVGDLKYGSSIKLKNEEIALWSQSISLIHPTTKEAMLFKSNPHRSYPWNLFQIS